MESFNYNRLGLASRKAPANIQKVHLQSQGISILESRRRIPNCLLVNLILKAPNADVKSDSFDIQIQLSGFSQQELALLARHATELLTEPNLVCCSGIETQAKQ